MFRFHFKFIPDFENTLILYLIYIVINYKLFNYIIYYITILYNYVNREL